MNKFIATGRLSKAIELKYTQSGKAVGSFTLAVQRDFKNANGDYEADFLMCQVWGKTAEIMANHLNKGSKVLVEGRIATRNYDNAEGKKVYVTEVVVERFEFLDSKGGEKQEAPRKTDDPFAGEGKAIEIDDDSLPF